MAERRQSEIVQRYNIFKERLDAVRKLEYQQVTSRAPATTIQSEPHREPVEVVDPPNIESGSRRYFQCFYDSFEVVESAHHRDLRQEVFTFEQRCRAQLVQQEAEEVTFIARGYADVLSAVIPDLHFVNTLNTVDAESVARSVLIFDYYSMLIEACIVEELLCRRHTTYNHEPNERTIIEVSEAPDWLRSYRLQVQREEQFRRDFAAGKKTEEIRRFEHQQRLRYQRFLYEQLEIQERFEIEKTERLYAGIIAEKFVDAYREAYVRQRGLRVVQAALNATAVGPLLADEASYRTNILFEQRDCFRMIQGTEIRSYLASKRSNLVNERVESRVANLPG